MKTRRRSFLAAAGVAPLFVPRSVRGANDRITYALIGSGGRGRYLNRNFQEVGAQCAALCDVYSVSIEKAVAESPAGVKTYHDYHDVLADPSIDAVVLAGPDHHHCPMLLASLKAGKDVYAEKPLSWSLEQSDTMIKAVRASDRVVQIGMQRRSIPEIIRTKRLVDDGLLGKITMVKAQWNWNNFGPLDNSPLPGNLDWEAWLGDAPKRPLEPMRYRWWRGFKDYAGGNMTDQGTHLMDVVQWFTKSGPPKAAVANGFVAQMTGSEHPDVFSAVFEFDNMMATWTLNYANDFQNGWQLTFMGTEASLVLNSMGFTVWQTPWAKNPEPLLKGRLPGPGVPTIPHIRNFLECIKSRKDPNCTVEIAAAAVAGPHLANIAMYGRKRATMDSVRASS